MLDPHRTRPSGQSGMALVAVLGFVAALSLVLIGVTAASRSTLDAANRHLLRAQAQMAIESAVEHAASTLAGARGTLPSLVTAPSTIEVGGFRVRVSVRSERGKVDLNFADQALLAALFRAAGASQDKANALAAAVEDWRDGDDLVHLNGAERQNYLAAGLKHVPENKPFRSAAEVQRVFGMTPRIFACIGSEMTVLTQSPGIEVAHAAPALQRELGVEPTAPGSRQAAVPLTSAQPVTPGDIFEVTAELEDPQRKIRRGERVSVRVTGNPSEPYWIIGVEPLFPIRTAQDQCPVQGRST
jgi:general secretion pathway protein K